MESIKRIYNRLRDEQAKRQEELIKQNHGLAPEDQCWALDFEIDEELYDDIEKMFEADGFTCWPGDTWDTYGHSEDIDWLMVITVEPKDIGN